MISLLTFTLLHKGASYTNKVWVKQKGVISHNVVNQGLNLCWERCPHLLFDHTLNKIAFEGEDLWETKQKKTFILVLFGILH